MLSVIVYKIMGVAQPLMPSQWFSLYATRGTLDEHHAELRKKYDRFASISRRASRQVLAGNPSLEDILFRYINELGEHIGADAVIYSQQKPPEMSYIEIPVDHADVFFRFLDENWFEIYSQPVTYFGTSDRTVTRPLETVPKPYNGGHK